MRKRLENKDLTLVFFILVKSWDSLQSQPEGRGEVGHAHPRDGIFLSPAAGATGRGARAQDGFLREAAGLHTDTGKGTRGVRRNAGGIQSELVFFITSRLSIRLLGYFYE